MNRGKILIVEDEKSIQHVVRNYLEASGYEVTCVDDGLKGIDQFGRLQPDLVVLDVNLPGLNGFQVAEYIRRESDVYIIMLTARDDEDDRVRGLRIGADDYVPKPFSPRELVARVDAVMRRRREQPTQQQHLRFKHVSIDIQAHEAHADSGLIALTATEFDLLVEFLRHAGQVLSRQQLLDRVWGENFYGNERVVDVYVGQVRRKLQDATGVNLFQTVRGVGYKFVDEKRAD